jgi:hypothetical protein
MQCKEQRSAMVSPNRPGLDQAFFRWRLAHPTQSPAQSSVKRATLSFGSTGTQRTPQLCSTHIETANVTLDRRL